MISSDAFNYLMITDVYALVAFVSIDFAVNYWCSLVFDDRLIGVHSKCERYFRYIHNEKTFTNNGSYRLKVAIGQK